MTWDEYVVELDEMHAEIERLKAENERLKKEADEAFDEFIRILNGRG